jgi:arylsulfatase A
MLLRIFISAWLSMVVASSSAKPTNILLILADDLGYGDTSVFPFVGSEIRTPNLEKMAARGTIMTNFHTAASTCSPTRASILTGLYPWRLGMKAVFEYGGKQSNRDDWLIQMPTVAAVFQDANYSTLHSGKWHLGGMRDDDYDMRLLPPPTASITTGRRSCQHPGPNQQGFSEYVSVLDGPGSPRQNTLQVSSQLYKRGCEYLLHNDMRVDKQYNANHFGISGYLSYCEAAHGMRMMNASIAAQKPFYLQVWFHAPHGPWEEIPGYKNYFASSARSFQPAEIAKLPICETQSTPNEFRYCRSKNSPMKVTDKFADANHVKYASMVSDMDKAIGLLLDNIKALDIENNTLVVFLSDNGPEDFYGGTGGFRNNKRYIYEGGIRVPAIFQWVGTIPAGKAVDVFGVSVDLFPTFLDAANVKASPNVYFDGLSLLPILIPENVVAAKSVTASHGQDTHAPHLAVLSETKKAKRLDAIFERVTLWHNDFEGPRMTAAWLFDYKVIIDEHNKPLEMFDMRSDRYEKFNLLGKISTEEIANVLKNRDHSRLTTMPWTKAEILTHRRNSDIHRSIFLHIYSVMLDFASHGNEAHSRYLASHRELFYNATYRSDTRSAWGGYYKLHSQSWIEAETKAFLQNNKCTSPLCMCDRRRSSAIVPLPFLSAPHSRRYLNPRGFLNASHLFFVE